MADEDESKRLFISFSGGETSAYMTKWCLENWRSYYDEIVVLFANTGQEHEETLKFVERCDQQFGLGVVWVEAVVDPEKGKGNKHRVVDFDTASRNGEPFEDMIAKQGIPCQFSPHCTRDLKLAPMRSYLRSLGWKSKSYDTAIGIRNDEVDRMSPEMDKNRVLYPFISHLPIGKKEVNLFWSRMPFRLRLKGYEGNCKTCWKKSTRKLMTIAREDPDAFEFMQRMERKYPYVGPEFSKENPPDRPRTFFRGHVTAEHILRAAQTEEFTPAADDADVYPEEEVLGLDIDTPGGGCSESCEVFTGENPMDNDEEE